MLEKRCAFKALNPKLKSMVFGLLHQNNLNLLVNDSIHKHRKVKETEKVQCAILLHLIGDEALEIYNTFTFGEGKDRDKLNVLEKKFEDYVNPRKNTVFERYKFWECKQKVFGVGDIRLKERLLRESSELTLEKAASLCRAVEESAKQLKELRKQNVDPSEPEVHVVKKPTRGESLFDCNRCGTKHAVRSCPAFGKPCHKCKRKNHSARMCQMSRNSSVDEVSENTGEANTRNDPTLKLNTAQQVLRFVSVGINGTQVRFKLDTGAEANVLPFNVYSSLKISTSLQKTDVVLTSYGNFNVKPEGKVFLRCVVNGQSEMLPFFVVTVQSTPILGLQAACKKLNLVKKVNEVAPSPSTKEHIHDYPEVFEGLGSMDGEYHIVVDKTVKPVIHPPRKKRDGSLRLCLDPRDLNKAIQREHHRIPTAEDIATRLSAPEVFQKKNEALFARDEKEHDEIMAKLLEREKAENVKFNPEKLQYKVKEVKYMGNIVSESGQSTKPVKLQVDALK
ncbi:Hypothetical predicted protein, partial [Paramuricea clavata]